MKKVKVIQLVESLEIGGLERAVAIIAEGLDREKYNPEVWCVARGGKIADELIRKGIDVKMLGISSYYNPFNIFKLAKLFKKSKPDILHTHIYFANTVGRIAAKIAGVPIVITHVHSTYWQYNKRNLFIERFLASFTYKIICVSNAVKRFVLDYEKIKEDRIIVVYNGIGFPEESSPVPQSQLSGVPGKKIVGTVASLTANKGHKYLIEAATEVIANFPDVHFFIVGDGHLRKVLEEQARASGIISNLTFAGIRTDVLDLLPAFDIFVLPSLEREGLGVSIIEAMASGLPVVATNIGGIPEVVRDKENGFLVPPGNPHSLAEKILELLNDEEKAQEMGRIGRKIFEEKFNARIMVQRIERLYDEAIQNTLSLPLR